MNTEKNINEEKDNTVSPVVMGSTYLKMKQDWITPYNAFTKDTYSTAEYWASKLGKTTDEFCKDVNNKFLDQWFEVYCL